MPFQQLLAVLPAASMELLPEAYRVTQLSYTCKICVCQLSFYLYSTVSYQHFIHLTCSRFKSYFLLSDKLFSKRAYAFKKNIFKNVFIKATENKKQQKNLS